MVTLTPSNYEQIAFKLKHQLDQKKLAEKSTDRAKNMIRITDDNQRKIIQSESLVIKSPAGALGKFVRGKQAAEAQGFKLRPAEVAQEGRTNDNSYSTTPKKLILNIAPE